MNDKAMAFFEKMASDTQSPNSVKLAKNSDFSEYDADFIMKYADKNTKILDLGSGTGLIINKIYDKVKKIVAVEPFVNFSKFISKTDNIIVVNKNFCDFFSEEKFDLITIFGTMHYFSKEEAFEIYQKFKSNLSSTGILIIKNQFGLNKDVEISGFSEELNQNYYAQYRHIATEKELLSLAGFKNIEVSDIYPSECNRWENTHFYAITANV